MLGYTNLGSRVSQIREAKDMSQEQVARSAKLSRRRLADIESGKATNPTIDLLFRLALALEVTVEELLGSSQPGDLILPSTLRAFALENKLSCESTLRLAQIPRPGSAPKTLAEWGELYRAVRRYIEA